MRSCRVNVRNRVHFENQLVPGTPHWPVEHISHWSVSSLLPSRLVNRTRTDVNRASCALVDGHQYGAALSSSAICPRGLHSTKTDKPEYRALFQTLLYEQVRFDQLVDSVC